MISGKLYSSYSSSSSCIFPPTPTSTPRGNLHLSFLKISSTLRLISFQSPSLSFPSSFVSKSSAKSTRFSSSLVQVYSYEGQNSITLSDLDDLSENGVVYKKTLAMVECSMFAALNGLVYFLSNSLALENYFGCFFCLPIVISSMRWGISAGRKTMVATFLLLLVLSGPVKALTYLLRHGLVGFTMGSLWRLGANWSTSIFLCTIVRAFGAVGYVLVSSFLIRENILALITINIHASLTLIFTAWGVNLIPSMNAIYAIFGTLVFLNCGCFMFLLHLLYSIFLTRLGLKTSLTLPRWLEKAM
ncbi:uncharacterized protein LOC101204847 isoform X2 [Cucumis sativus]|uniref:Uncharacterized protein n=1 Tax=Cucumis sativus TaxID=3659 RepID=A0A0A0K8H0_CUCSA|nr:uncharacterized protein LOC101204847 isoform X2 [Cucumis sativus]KGN46010.1 hypothetical protein Csa_005645 [Cucumis sativus]